MLEVIGKNTKIRNLIKNKKFYIPFLTLLFLGTSYGGSYGIIQSQIDEKLENLTFDNMFLKILDMKVTNLSETNLICNLTFESKPNSMFSDVKFMMSRFYIQYQNLTAGLVQLNPSNNIFDFQKEPLTKEFNLSFPNPNFINRTIQDFLYYKHINLTFLGEIRLLEFGALYPPFDFDFTLNFTQENLFPELFNNFNVTMNDFIFKYDDFSYTIDFSTTFFNPLNLDVEINLIIGNISFNDVDGLGDLPPLNDIHLAQINYTWQDEPLIIERNLIFSRNFSLSGKIDSLQTVLRILFDLEENQIEINLENIIINMSILDYKFSIGFSVSNITFSTENFTF